MRGKSTIFVKMLFRNGVTTKLTLKPINQLDNVEGLSTERWWTRTFTSNSSDLSPSIQTNVVKTLCHVAELFVKEAHKLSKKH